MLEGQPCLVSRGMSSCEGEPKWGAFMQYNLLNQLAAKKPRLTDSPSDQPLIPDLGRDVSIHCLLRCSRSDYGAVACLGRGFRALVGGGELYRLRRLHGVVEHWVYFSCAVLEWEGLDPVRRRWFSLPPMPPPTECFAWSDKESLAVGTELLVFGKEVKSHVVLRYSILSNGWSAGAPMLEPRCLFGSASTGGVAIVAGGCSVRGAVFASAELYNSETRTWAALPAMNRARKMCSGVFMGGKFYVIGGTGARGEFLTCGEEFDLETGRWRLVPEMFPERGGARGAPPLVAVVKEELYAADCADKALLKYDERSNSWRRLGSLPERPASVNGWGLAFRACGERLIVIGGPRTGSGGYLEINAWVPRDGVEPEWELLARKPSGGFVYNCAVMGC